MREKGGISAIVATVLIILITVAGVVIIWAAIIPMIKENIAFSGLEGQVSILSSGGYTVYDASRDVAIVQVKRDVDDGVMNRIKISFVIGGNSVSSNVVAPESGQTKTYTFDLSGYGEPESVSVAPIFVASSGKEKEGSITSKVDIRDGTLSESDGGAYDIGGDYFYEMPMTGLVSWWKFNGDANDSVGDNDGDLKNGAQIIDNVLNLDGDGDYVNVTTNSLSIAGKQTVTLSAWANFNGFGDIGNGIYCDSQNGWWRFQLGTYNTDCSGDRIAFITRDSSSEYNGAREPLCGEKPNLNEWYHYVAVYDSVNNIKSLYVNGILNVSTSTSVNDFIDAPSSNINIGETTYNFNGSIDNVMIFNKSLSQEEITAIYENQKK